MSRARHALWLGAAGLLGLAVGLWLMAGVPGPVPPPAPEQVAAPVQKTWAKLLKRCFEVEVLRCPQCRGPRRVLAVLTRQRVVGKILRHLDLPDKPPPRAPAGGPQQHTWWGLLGAENPWSPACNTHLLRARRKISEIDIQSIRASSQLESFLPEVYSVVSARQKQGQTIIPTTQ